MSWNIKLLCQKPLKKQLQNTKSLKRGTSGYKKKLEKVKKNLKGKLTRPVDLILKNELKSNNFSYVIAKGKKICNSFVDNFSQHQETHTHKYH